MEQPRVGQIHTLGNETESNVLRYAAAAEYRQPHPIAKAILAKASGYSMSNPWQQLYQIGLQRRTSIAGSVAKKQSAWLHSCLQRNQKSAYGQQFQFEKIQTVNQFRNQVPLVTYQDVEPWIERVARGEKNVLFEGTPILFERTGGSTGGSKLIPYSAASLADFQTAILPWLADVVKYYNLTTGCAYWAISPALRAAEKTVGGIP